MTEDADEHVIEAMGKCRIVIRNGRVVEVGEAQIRECPLAKRFAFPVLDLDSKSIKANIEHRISAFGMCTPRREVMGSKEFVGFGASEILSFGLQARLIDAVVLASDGAGTVVVSNPGLVQGIGGRMSGLVRTVPYPDVIRRIEDKGGIVLDKSTARIDQEAGIKLAYEIGFEDVAVTVALPDEARRIRERYPRAIIFGVHVTGLTREEAEVLVSASDLVTACASGTIRDVAGKKALVQAGISIPIFAMTETGKRLIIEKIGQGKEQVLVKATRLPALGDQQPDPLI